MLTAVRVEPPALALASGAGRFDRRDDSMPFRVPSEAPGEVFGVRSS